MTTAEDEKWRGEDDRRRAECRPREALGRVWGLGLGFVLGGKREEGRFEVKLSLSVCCWKRKEKRSGCTEHTNAHDAPTSVLTRRAAEQQPQGRKSPGVSRGRKFHREWTKHQTDVED